MTDTACLTITRNESVFLSLWVRHYAPVGHLCVLDHESDDGSTAKLGPDVTVIPVSRPYSDDVHWMRRVVQETITDLLKVYPTVVFTEVDEFLCPEPEEYNGLRDYLGQTRGRGAAGREVVTATGYDVCPPLPDGIESILQPYMPWLAAPTWKRNDRYDKTLIVRRPMQWEVGFHRPEPGYPRPEPDPELYLLHLHYADRELAWDRLQARQKGKQFVPGEGGYSFQNKYTDRGEFDRHFDAAVSGATPMPDRFWGILR